MSYSINPHYLSFEKQILACYVDLVLTYDFEINFFFKSIDAAFYLLVAFQGGVFMALNSLAVAIQVHILEFLFHL